MYATVGLRLMCHPEDDALDFEAQPDARSQVRVGGGPNTNPDAMGAFVPIGDGASRRRTLLVLRLLLSVRRAKQTAAKTECR